jgi:hypothetical protein
MRARRSLLMLLTLIQLGAAVSAAVPPVITYQGRLTQSDGSPYTDNKLVRFAVYNGNGSEVWNSGFLNISFQDGLFTVCLGETPQPALTPAVFADSVAALGITVDTDPELSPRTSFTTQPFAYHAVEAEVAADVPAGSIDSTEVDRTQVQLRVGDPCPAGQFIRAIDEHGNVTCGAALSISYSAGPGIEIEGSVISLDSKGCSSGYVLKWNGTGWDCVAETGDISAVTAGSGLAGGSTSGEAMLWIPDEGVSYTKIDTGGVRTSEIADLTITNIDISNSAAIIASKISGTAATLSLANEFTGINEFTGTTSATTFRVGDSSFYATSTGVRIGDVGSPLTTTCLTIERNFNSSSTLYGQSTSVVNAGTGFIGGGYFGSRGGDYAAGIQAQAIGDGTERRGLQGSGDAITDGLITGYSYGVKGFGGDGAYSYGVYGHTNEGTNRYAIYGESPAGVGWHAGYFYGNAHVTGTLSKGAGSFKIDHPLDPENKYLQHSFVESPDMMNVYNGNIVTDGNGESVVALPDYFEALNRDFRYQLTVIGEFAQAIVAQEISNNRFMIRTDKPNIKVSCQVTGVRKDAFANANRIEVEVDKNADERGKYAHPEAWGRDVTFGVDFARSAASQAGSSQIVSKSDLIDQQAEGQKR